jgi:hypothetical protein
LSLIGGLSWSRSAPGPLADEAVLLADPGFVLEPDFDRRAGSFFKPLDDPLVLSRMTRPGADVREAKLLQEFSDIARMKVDAEPFGNDTLGGA